MSKTIIIYGSTTGNTEEVARKIGQKIVNSKVMAISELVLDQLNSYDNILLGTSTWGFGDLQDDWVDGIDLIANAKLTGKKVGFFGLGDQVSYSETFVDGIGIIYEAIKDSGAQFIGQFSTDGMSFDNSKAVVAGNFLGVVIDIENQEDQSNERIEKWVESLGI